jgi:hypothetical protein
VRLSQRWECRRRQLLGTGSKIVSSWPLFHSAKRAAFNKLAASIPLAVELAQHGETTPFLASLSNCYRIVFESYVIGRARAISVG